MKALLFSLIAVFSMLNNAHAETCSKEKALAYGRGYLGIMHEQNITDLKSVIYQNPKDEFEYKVFLTYKSNGIDRLAYVAIDSSCSIWLWHSYIGDQEPVP